MRLLKLNANGSFSLTTFFGNIIPSYAILSHTWEADNQEVTFQDFMDGVGSSKVGYRKIQFCGEQARKDGLQYFWVDSCCIDKSSSAELSEAINSMFRWYRNAAKCYIYLSDVSTAERERSSRSQWELRFSQSRWFSRGWTLQELLAPLSVEFFSVEGKRLGDKNSLELQIQQITGITVQALQGSPLSQVSVEERMSWAVGRETTIEEDQAYSLLGIFDIHMPLIYGEGKKHAFRRLQEEIDKLSSINNFGQVKWNEKELKCLQSLRISAYEQFKDRNPDRLKGTCEWFLQHDHFRKWQQSSSSSLLWASADPGCGKSVLAKSLIDQEMKATESRITCYFFFKDDNETQKSITIALSALLHQLFSQKRSLIQHAMADYEVEGNQLPQSFHKLWSILAKATSDSVAGEVVCILDALDECEESGRYEIIDALNTFYKQATSSKRSASQLKFLVTSRPYFDIERRFTDLTRTFPTIRLQGEKESEAISCEINIVIKWRVSDLRQELELDDSEQSTLENELLNMTHRTYLWLKLIFEVICDEIGLTKKKLKQIIGTLPITVDQAYEAILSKIRDKDSKRTQKLLNIIVVAKRPLTLKEMNIALAIEDHHRSYEDLDLENEARFESTVRNICGLFVSIIDQKVYLIHQTAKEFLIAKSEVLLGGWKHSLDPMESELLMARICITYLMFTVFDDHLFGEATSSAIDKQTQNHGYLSYAASFWAFHHRQAQRGATKELLQSVVDICKTQGPRFQNWFYVYWNTLLFSSHLGFTSSLLVASYFGHEIVVKLLLETGEADVDSKNKAGRTPLCYAAENGHEAVVKLLLKTGKADVDSKDEASRTPLSYAAENGHEAVVKLLLKTGKAEVNSKNWFGRTSLCYAAENGHEAIVKLLLKTGKADVDSKNKAGRTPLCYAAENGHEAIVKLLLKTGKADVDSKDNDSQTPLLWAAESGHDAVVNLVLVTGKAEVDSKNNRGQTPLLCAAGKGHDAVVKLLLETGEVEVNAKAESGRGPFEHYGQTPLSLAAEYGYEAVVKLLLETGKAEVNSKDDIGVRVGLTFAIGGREFKRDRYGQTPLSLAAEYGHEAVVKLLLETGEAEVDSKDDTFGRTPLLWAAAYGHEAVVKLLLETGKAEVDSKDDIHGRAPLSWAAEYGHEAVVKLLLATGEAKVDLRDNYGQTSLYMAAGKGHDAVVKLLLATGKAEVNSKHDEGQMPLLYAAGMGHKAVVKLLLETGKAEVDSKDDTHGRTPLSWAAERGHEAIVKLLLDTGEAEADSKDNDGQTPLLLAAEYGRDAVVKLLLETGEVEADSKDDYGRTPLSLAAKYGHKAVVKLLLETGRVKIDSKDNFGRTPLFYAAENSHDAVVKLLQPISSS